MLKFKMIKKNNSVYLSDMCQMGGFFVRGRLVESNLLSRKYEGLIFFDHKPYHVYIRYGFCSGAQITGIAVPLYPDIKTAYHAGGDFSKAYKKCLREDRNQVYTMRKIRNFYGFLVQMIMFAVFFLYIERMILVAEEGLTSGSVILSILYPVIAALCYYARTRCQ